MSPAFAGEVAEHYVKYRRGYDARVIEWLADAVALDRGGVVVDLGCGTGQLSIPLSVRAEAVIGVDPEPDMLVHAARRAADHGRANIVWMLGADRDLPALGALLGDAAVAAITLGNAIHLMDHESLFRSARPLLRPGGAIVILANGVPLWQDDTACSKALRSELEEWFDTTLESRCGTDDASRRRYAAAMSAAGYADIQDTVLSEFEETLDLAYVVGHLYSAIPADQLPAGDDRRRFEEHIRRALEPEGVFVERVKVSALVGRPG